MSELEVTRVMSDLRGLYERGKLSDEQIARLDAIGFNWERQKSCLLYTSDAADE